MLQRKPGWQWRHRKERGWWFDNDCDSNSYNYKTPIGEGGDGDGINNY